MIAILYSIAATIAVIAGSAQIYRLIQVGRSDELSLATWLLWFVTQAIQVVYMVTLLQPVLITVSVMWLLLYSAMVGLILYYRRFPRSSPIVETTNSVLNAEAD